MYLDSPPDSLLINCGILVYTSCIVFPWCCFCRSTVQVPKKNIISLYCVIILLIILPKELMSPHATVTQWGSVLTWVDFDEGGNPKQVEIDWNSESSRIQWWMEVWLTDSPEKTAHGFWSNGHLSSYWFANCTVQYCTSLSLITFQYKNKQ